MVASVHVRTLRPERRQAADRRVVPYTHCQPIVALEDHPQGVVIPGDKKCSEIFVRHFVQGTERVIGL